jgi:hypothetical protein
MTTASTNSGDRSGISVRHEGDLAHTPLAEVLRRIAVEERSGDLQITGPSFIKIIYSTGASSCSRRTIGRPSASGRA